jgi:hypothetical protein
MLPSLPELSPAAEAERVMRRMEVMADNFLVRTDCEVRMHCNNLKLSQVPAMCDQM